MRLKAGVRVHPAYAMTVLLVTLEDLFAGENRELVITSGMDGVHKQDSLHYSGQAVDVRTRDMSKAYQRDIAGILRERLGPDFDIVLERDHLHCEYDPK